MGERARLRFLINTAYILTVVVGTALLLRYALLYFAPFLAGALVAWAVQRPAKALARKTRLKRSFWAAALAILLLLGIYAVLIFGVGKGLSALGNLISDFSDKMPDFHAAVMRIKDGASGLLKRLPPEFSSTAESVYTGLPAKLAEGLAGVISRIAARVVKKAPSILFSGIVALVSSGYIAADFEKLARFFKGVVGSGTYRSICRVKEIITGSVFKLVKGYLFLSGITFVLLSVGFFVLHIRYPLPTAFAIALIDILPVLGTGTVLVPWGVAAFLLSDYRIGTGLLVLYAIAAVVRNFAEPKVMGKQMGINPLFTLIAMFAGLKLFGGAGVIVLPMALIVTVEYYKQEMERESVGQEDFSETS